MSRTVIVAGARTPIGKLSGCFARQSAADLAAVAIKGALDRAGIEPRQVDHVVMGQVLQAGQGQLAGRQAAARAGIPMDAPTTMINKMCLSGLQALHLADLMVRAGEADIVLAGGMESMTAAPYLLPGARAGYGLGDKTVVDSMMGDGLTCAFENLAMGAATEKHVANTISREDQDEFAYLSHRRAAEAITSGRFADEIVPVTVSPRRGDPVDVITDEGVREETTVKSLSALRPVFSPDGSITAGNASQISDGAAALIVTSLDRAMELGLTPLCEILGYGQVAGPDASLLLQPSRAIKRALEQAHVELADIDFVEINEAFAAVALASMRDLGLDDKVVNINGGAIALGHPIGMSGARLALSLATEIRRQGGGFGVAGLCGGGGQGDAIVLGAVA